MINVLKSMEKGRTVKNPRCIAIETFPEFPVPGTSVVRLLWRLAEPTVIVALNNQVDFLVEQVAHAKGRIKAMSVPGELRLRFSGPSQPVPKIFDKSQYHPGYFPWQVEAFISDAAYEAWVTRAPEDVEHVQMWDLPQHVLRMVADVDKRRGELVATNSAGASEVSL
jgi:23S rRNA U2552 (ribose-2'-O)-methylase RlmE/FtsJ